MQSKNGKYIKQYKKHVRQMKVSNVIIMGVSRKKKERKKAIFDRVISEISKFWEGLKF